MGASLHHCLTQYLIIEGAAASLALNHLIIGAVPGRKCYETALIVIGGEESSAPFKKFRVFLGGHEVLSFSVIITNKYLFFALDEYLLSGSFEQHVV